MSVYIGDVQTFAGVIADKPQVLKIAEEYSEVFSAWECWKILAASDTRRADLINECADLIQATCNLLSALGVDDMRQPMQVCYVRNSERGREYANDGFSAQNDVTAQDVDANDENVTQDSREQLEDDIDEFGRRFIACELRDIPLVDVVRCWLDRQAAITANETNHDNPYVGLVRGKQWERTEISDYYCGRCGWKVTDHDSYCPECGGALHETPNKPDGKFDARETAETPETDAVKGDIRDFDDSREKLEADIGLFVARYMPKEDSPKMFEAVCSFLNRQVAITAIEVARERYDIERDLTAARDELQEALNAAAGKWAKADARCSELKAENEALKTKVETLRSKLSKMLDAASTIQHIGNLP